MSRGWLVWLTLGTCSLVALVLIAFAFGPLLAAGTATIAAPLIIRLGRRLWMATAVVQNLMSLTRWGIDR